MAWSSRLASIATILTLSVGNVALCAGWQATPEARMACCQNGQSCPMHKSASPGPRAKRTITQAQADNCCAATANHTQSSDVAFTFALPGITALPATHDAVVSSPVLALQEWRAFVPLPVSPVPKHLLLSVLLV